MVAGNLDKQVCFFKREQLNESTLSIERGELSTEALIFISRVKVSEISKASVLSWRSPKRFHRGLLKVLDMQFVTRLINTRF